MSLKLEILTPTKKVLTTETQWVTLPGSLGELGILPEHLPLMTTMDTGVLQFERGGKVVKMAVHYGYATVSDDAITVLSEMVEKADEIDLDRARNAESKARAELERLIGEQQAEDHRMNKFTAKLQRALIRQQAAR